MPKKQNFLEYSQKKAWPPDPHLRILSLQTPVARKLLLHAELLIWIAPYLGNEAFFDYGP